MRFPWDGWDCLFVVGGCLCVGGLYWIYPPLALLGAGGSLVCLAMAGARKLGKKESVPDKPKEQV